MPTSGEGIEANRVRSAARRPRRAQGGRWDAARAIFQEALAEEATPEAFEGLSWAAWWLDDAEAVFAARESAYRLYRKAGQPGSAARLATWLAVDQLDFRGARAVANGWLRRAHRLLDPLVRAPRLSRQFHLESLRWPPEASSEERGGWS